MYGRPSLGQVEILIRLNLAQTMPAFGSEKFYTLPRGATQVDDFQSGQGHLTIDDRSYGARKEATEGRILWEAF